MSRTLHTSNNFHNMQQKTMTLKPSKMLKLWLNRSLDQFPLGEVIYLCLTIARVNQYGGGGARAVAGRDQAAGQRRRQLPRRGA